MRSTSLASRGDFRAPPRCRAPHRLEVTLAAAARSWVMRFRFAQLVGRYRLVVSEELLAFVERTFVEPAPERERAAIRQDALAEAAAAELLIEPDGTVISRAGEVEFYRIRLSFAEAELSELRFEKAPGQSVTLRLLDADTLLTVQPGKPNAVFTRVEERGSPRSGRA